MTECSAALKEKPFGTWKCRKIGCKELQNDPEYPSSPMRCTVLNTIPGNCHCCVKELDAEQFIRVARGKILQGLPDLDAQRPGIRNCPDLCPYKVVGKKDNGKGRMIKSGRCAFTGEDLTAWEFCLCHVLGNDTQNYQIGVLEKVIERHRQEGPPTEDCCQCKPCPDGVIRCGIGDIACPIIRIPFVDLKECPLWRIPAKMLPAIAAEETAKPAKKISRPKEDTPYFCHDCSIRQTCPAQPFTEECRELGGPRGPPLALAAPGGTLPPKQPDNIKLKMIPEFRNLIPGLSTEEFRGLEESLKSEGCRDPIVTWKGVIVDGHNRYNICTSLKIPFTTIERDFADETEVKIWIIKNQFSRRNLLPYVRATLAESLKEMIAAKNKDHQKRGRGGKLLVQNSAQAIIDRKTREQVAKLANVSHDTISRVESINENASEEVKQKLATGEISINKAYNEMKNPGLFTSETDEWYTPKEIIESVLKVFGGQIDVDPCSNSQEIPNVPAALHFTKEDDGLTKPWFGKVYMNPPYGREIKDWVLKLIEEKEKGNIEEAIALVPARTDTEWFTAFDPHPWCAVKGRLKFSDNPNSAPFPSAIFYLGRDEDLEGLERFFLEFSRHGIIYQTIQQQMEAKDA